MKKHAGKLVATSFFTIVFIFIINWMDARTVYLQTIENDFIKALKAEMEEFNKEMPEDRVYMQFDKPFYQPGESIWFSAYLCNGSNMKPSLKSDIIHVELISPKGNIEQHIKVVGKNGQMEGDFQLGAEAPGGIYKVKAYTNWQMNEKNTPFFERDLQVQEYLLPALKMELDFERKAFGSGDQVLAKVELNSNENKPLAHYKFRYVASLEGEKFQEKTMETDESGTGYLRFHLPADLKTNDGLLNVMIDYQGSTESISRSIPIVLNKINFTMYPEGGDLVEDLSSRVAFRALNEFNKAADIEGMVVDGKGNHVTSFSSLHMGMGSFNIKPLPGEKYYAKITKPRGIGQRFELPEVLAKGYLINAGLSEKDEIPLMIQSTEKEELSLVVQVRSKIYYATSLNAVPGANNVLIPTAGLPIGVAQITLFDSKGIERAERLLFVNKNKKLQVSISTDKEKYQPREKVKMTVTVKDDRGLPMPAHFSLAVINDQLLSFADDKSGNILSKLLLEEDIKDKVEEPAFYFDGKDPKAGQALDLLLMTSGWRRFTWEQVMTKDLPKMKFSGEKAAITGILYDGETGKPVVNAKMKMQDVTVSTNEKGQYEFRNIEPVFPVMLQSSADGYNASNHYVYDFTKGLETVYLYKPDYYSKRYQNYPSSAAAGNVEDKRMPLMAGYAAPPNFQGSKNKGAVKKEQPLVKRNIDIPAPAPVKIQNEKAKEAVHAEGMMRGKDDRLARWANADMDEMEEINQAATYYRARQFSSPVYDQKEKVEERNDFRSTIYWNGRIDIDRTGKKVIEFFNSDDITSFRAIAEGLGVDGMIGHAEATYFTQLPFSMTTKIPSEIVTGDIVSIPLTLKNNTDGPLGGIMEINVPKGMNPITSLPVSQTIMPGKSKTIYLDYKVSEKTVGGEFKVSFKSCGLSDAFSQTMKVISRGFPVTASFSGQEIEKEFNLELSHIVDSSVRLSFTAYPSVLNDLMSGIEGILREPGGCFEQTSMSSYPNAMVLDYLKMTDNKDDKTLSQATALLERGYKRLSTFETKDKGYEWFGSAPGHEALTAYGLMQFSDMKRVGGEVDQEMMDRTAKWIMSRRDGHGGFLRNARALDNFGSGSEEITNAYITYSLSEAGYKDINIELDNSYGKALGSHDPYMLALMANAMYRSGDSKRADKLSALLYPMQNGDGSWTGKTHSITYSTGQSLTIETTSLVVMAILKQASPDYHILTKAVQYIIGSRSGSGTFGNTQGTVLALKALTEFAKASKKTATEGTIEFCIDGKKVAEKFYAAGEKGNIEIAGLEKYIRNGKQKLKVKFKGTKDPLPYAIAVTWNTTLPQSSDQCALDLRLKLPSTSANVGETVRLSVTLNNKKEEALPSPIAIIGIPAGFTVQPWQLKEMQEKNVFDYYEVKGNNIIIYYRGMKAKEIRNINFDLKAEVPGEYSSPASSAYLYYTNEFKSWKALEKVVIKKQMVQN